jgi:hypothetical protein
MTFLQKKLSYGRSPSPDLGRQGKKRKLMIKIAYEKNCITFLKKKKIILWYT